MRGGFLFIMLMESHVIHVVLIVPIIVNLLVVLIIAKMLIVKLEVVVVVVVAEPSTISQLARSIAGLLSSF